MLTLDRLSALDLAPFFGRAAFPTIVTSDGELWMISSGYPIAGGQTAYLGGFVDSRIEGAQVPVPAGVVRGMWFAASAAPGSGQSFTYTLMKNGVATACKVTLTGAQRKGKSTVEVTCSDQDEICVRVEASALAAEANHNGSINFVPAA